VQMRPMAGEWLVFGEEPKLVSQQVEQGLLNLALSSVHAMQGERNLHSERQWGRGIVVGCRATGGDLEKPFDPFFTTRPDGTGLGLIYRIPNRVAARRSDLFSQKS
jgi:signal transduction histidine kinase